MSWNQYQHLFSSSEPLANDSAPKPGDPDFKKDLSLPMPLKSASKPDPRSHRTRSLNNYTDIDVTFKWAKAAANTGKEMPAIPETEGKEDRVETGECGSGQAETETNMNRYATVVQ